jgi:hypothetical protein
MAEKKNYIFPLDLHTYGCFMQGDGRLYVAKVRRKPEDLQKPFVSVEAIRALHYHGSPMLESELAEAIDFIAKGLITYAAK